MTSRASRTLRGVAAGGTATLVAAVSHAVAGHAAPNAASLGLATLFAVIAGIALTGRRLPRLRMAASVILSQAAYHVVFSTMGGAGETVTSGHHGGFTVATAPESVTVVSPGMWLAHGVAAALTILALAHGETVLRAVVELARPWRAVTVALPALPVLPLLPVAAAAPVLRSRDLLAACGVRGPPALLGAR